MDGNLTEVNASKELTFITYVIEDEECSYHFLVEDAIYQYVNADSSDKLRASLVSYVKNAGYVASETLGEDKLPFVQVFHSVDKGNDGNPVQMSIKVCIPPKDEDEGVNKLQEGVRRIITPSKEKEEMDPIKVCIPPEDEDEGVNKLQEGVRRIITPSKEKEEMDPTENNDFQSPVRKKFIASYNSPYSPLSKNMNSEKPMQHTPTSRKKLNMEDEQVPSNMNVDMNDNETQPLQVPSNMNVDMNDNETQPFQLKEDSMVSMLLKRNATPKKNSDMVEIENLPSKKFSMDSLLEFLNVEMREQVEFLTEEDFPAIAVLDLNHEKHSCIVKFDSVRNAVECCKLSFNFWNSELFLYIVKEGDKTLIPKKKTNKVKISHLPHKKFSEKSLIEFLNVEMREQVEFLTEDDSPAVAVLELNHEEHTCIVEFDNVQNAVECCGLPLNFWNSELFLTIVKEGDKTFTPKEKTNKVKISHLPHKKFSEKSLIEFLNVEMREQVEFLTEDDSPAVAVLELNHEEHTCIVEFNNVRNAIECCGLPLNFWNSELFLTIVKEEGTTFTPKEKTNKVKISHLPHKKFSEKSLIEFLNVEMREQVEFLTEDDSPAVAVLELNHEEHTCIVEFNNVQNAIECCGLPLNFWNSDLFLTIVKEEGTTFTPKEKTNKVKISHLPHKKFSEKSLIEFLNVEMREQVEFLTEDDSPAVAVLELNHEEHTCIVEFNNVQNAIECCGLPLNFWNSELLQEVIEENFVPKEKKMTNKVKVSNLPSTNFSTASFRTYFNEQVRKLLQMSEDEIPVVCLSELNHDHRTCVLEFRDAEMAWAACLIQNPQFGKSQLNVLQMKEDVPEVHTSSPVSKNFNQDLVFNCSDILKDPPSEQQKVSDQHADFPSGESDDDGDGNGTSAVDAVARLIPHNVKWRLDWPTLETLILLKYCIKYRDLLRSTATRNIGKGRVALWKSMLTAKLYYRQTTIKSKLATMKSMYKPNDESWPFNKFYAEYVNDKPIGSSNIREAIKCAMEATHEAASQSRFSNPSRKVGNKQNDRGVLLMENVLAEEHPKIFNDPKLSYLLIAEYMFRKDLFEDDKTRASELYREIKMVFHEKGYMNVNEENLSGRMNWLADQFKKRCDAIRNKTGTSDKAQQWIFYSPMGLLLENSYVVEPQKLVNMGSSNSIVVRDRKGTTQRSPSEIASVFQPGASYKSQRLACSLGIRDDLCSFKELLARKWFGGDSN